MHKADFYFALIFSIIVTPFLPFGFLTDFQNDFLYNESYWLITSFLKFALLATMGEVIGLRIRTGKYTANGFGLVPRALVWGFLGLTLKLAFAVFAAGAPAFIEHQCGVVGAIDSMKLKDVFDAIDHGVGGIRILSAFAISASLNVMYAPILMTFHKITDIHITETGGTIKGLFSPIKFVKILKQLDWHVQWNFIFMRTIPFFWIPIQSITFLLPTQYRIVFAAFLGIVLGVVLSVANLKRKTN